MTDRNIKIILEYDGSRYDGWQRQGNTERTIQGKLEQILERMDGQPVRVQGAGRTDAGVHARGQCASFHLTGAGAGMEPEAVKTYLNRYLPEDIGVLEAQEVPGRFHSRLSAVAKTYCYRIETAEKKSVFGRKYVYGLGQPLDTKKMEAAASLLLGTHDFRGFSSLRRAKKSTVRTIREIRIRREGTVVALSFGGDGFLYNMVRILTGTLVEIGCGQRPPESVLEVLESGDRSLAGFTAPPEGLCLEQVEYP